MSKDAIYYPDPDDFEPEDEILFDPDKIVSTKTRYTVEHGACGRRETYEFSGIWDDEGLARNAFNSDVDFILRTPDSLWSYDCYHVRIIREEWTFYERGLYQVTDSETVDEVFISIGDEE